MPQFTPALSSLQSPVPSGNRLIFVSGLHRSATTLLGELLTAHPQISGFHNTGASMNEGQYLQSVIRGAGGEVLDGVGSLALKPKNRLTERSALATPENARALWESWAGYWDLSKAFLVEKSPGHMTKLRLLCALFPGARFIVITRHPIAQAMAIRKWAGNRSSFQHVANWAVAHWMVRRDARKLPGIIWLRYEDLCAAPRETLARVLERTGLAADGIDPGPLRNSNEKYFEAWRARSAHPGFRAEAALIRGAFARQAGRWGYQLAPDRLQDLRPPHPAVAAHCC